MDQRAVIDYFLEIMIRHFKQLWSIVPAILIKHTATSHFRVLNTKTLWYMAMEILDLEQKLIWFKNKVYRNTLTDNMCIMIICNLFHISIDILSWYSWINNIFLVHMDQRSRWTIAITWRPLSVVCKLFTFQASSPKPRGRLEPNIAGMFLGWSSTNLLFFVPVVYSIWLPGPIICSDWLKFQRSSSLKLMNWLNPNCKWMIIGMSITKFLFFMSIGNPRWSPPQYID
jgi:hypothetical protein